MLTGGGQGDVRTCLFSSSCGESGWAGGSFCPDEALFSEVVSGSLLESMERKNITVSCQ